MSETSDRWAWGVAAGAVGLALFVGGVQMCDCKCDGENGDSTEEVVPEDPEVGEEREQAGKAAILQAAPQEEL